MENKITSMNLDELYQHRAKLRQETSWGKWNHQKSKTLRTVEEEIENRIFGEVLLY